MAIACALAALSSGAVATASGAPAGTAGAPTPASGTTGPQAAFSWFAPGPAPASWKHFVAVEGTAVVSDPPRLKPIDGGQGTITFAARGAHGAYLAFVHVTPQQGAENLTGWVAFRLALLKTDGAHQIHEDAAANNLVFRGGTGACVIDDYVAHSGLPFHEIACFVEGPHSGSVIVVATPPTQWRSYAAALERVVSSYHVL